MDSNTIAKPNLQKRHSLQLSQSVTPLPYAFSPTVSDVSVSPSTPINDTERSRSRHRKQSQLQSSKFRANNKIPFIQEDQSTKSGNSVSSYPSILALQPSFTNQATHSHRLSPINSPAAVAAQRSHTDKAIIDADDVVAVDDALATHYQATAPSPHRHKHHEHTHSGEDDDKTWVQSNLSPQSNSKIRSRASKSKTKTHVKTISSRTKSKSKSNSSTNANANPIINPNTQERNATSNSHNSGSHHHHHQLRTSNNNNVLSSALYANEDALDPRPSGYRSSNAADGVGAALYQQKSADPNRRWLHVDKQQQQQTEHSFNQSQLKAKSYDARIPTRHSPSLIVRQKQRPPHATETRNSLRTSNDSASTARKHKHTSLIITSGNKSKVVDIRRPHTSRILRTSNRSYLGGADTTHVIAPGPSFRYNVVQASDEQHPSETSSRVSNTSSRSSFTTVSRTSTATATTNMHLRSSSNVYNAKRRPVTIIRRSRRSDSALQENPNDMVRAASSIDYKMHLRQQQNKYQLHQQQHQLQQRKYGLFDGVYCNVDTKKPMANKAAAAAALNLTESELLERERFFMEAQQKSEYDESDVSVYRETSPQSMNIDDKLSSIHNVEHSLCKKEIHDAYERGFLAGYFLGVNIMQQQNK